MTARDKGHAIGVAVGEAMEALGLGHLLRAALAKVYGRCRFCECALTGRSADQSCEICYVQRVLGPAMAEAFAAGIEAGEEPDA